MTVPLRRTPVRFRCWLAGCVLALGAGFGALHAFAPGPDLAAIIREPGALLLLALILLADFYPTLPWMRDTNPFGEFIFSTPLAIAALMVYGPHSAIVFVIAGLAMTLALRMRWWRVVLNTALWGIQGLAAAGVLAVIWHWFSWTDQVPGWAILPITVVLTVVIEGLNVLLVLTSQVLARATTPRAYLTDWRRQVTIGTLDLTAPIPAVLAATQPVLLPLLAIAMIAALAGLRAVTSRTTQAGTDPLTGVPNRAYLLGQLTARLSAHDIERHPVMVLLVDLDRFKQVNDELGHLVGDRVLVEVARRLADAIRSTDVIARFGGDEFAVLLAGGSGQPQPEEVAARIRAAVARPVEIPGRSVRVGITVGWSQADRRDTDPMALLQRADARLYAAKAARPARTGAPEPAAATGCPDGFDGTESDTCPGGPAAGTGADAPEERMARSAATGTGWDPVWTGAQAGILPAHDGGAQAAPAR
ncbi:diguanylate cyclase domain-containing protein [Nakamurella sp.]|uniref:GGDEF domain-containing protein n=1 Tax=Nakamurella sp. TaxID=1869182 RepID=UPI003784B34F